MNERTQSSVSDEILIPRFFLQLFTITVSLSLITPVEPMAFLMATARLPLEPHSYHGNRTHADISLAQFHRPTCDGFLDSRIRPRVRLCVRPGSARVCMCICTRVGCVYIEANQNIHAYTHAGPYIYISVNQVYTHKRILTYTRLYICTASPPKGAHEASQAPLPFGSKEVFDP